MRRIKSRTLLVSAILSVSLAWGAAAPSYAQMAPSDAGISDADWALMVEIAEYNNAYTEYVSDSGEATFVMTGGTAANDLEWPSDFTGFSDPNLLIYLEYSQFSTNDEINAILDDTVTQIQNAGYSAAAVYDEDTDKVDVTTLAPSSVTGPLVSTYDTKINIIAADPTSQDAPGGTAHGSTKKHGTKKHDAKKHTAKKKVTKKKVTKKKASAKETAGSTTTPQLVKVAVTPPTK
ncbi:hypothetical protein [Streptomyces sp. YKOK-I1]